MGSSSMREAQLLLDLHRCLAYCLQEVTTLSFFASPKIHFFSRKSQPLLLKTVIAPSLSAWAPSAGMLPGEASRPFMISHEKLGEARM